MKIFVREIQDNGSYIIMLHILTSFTTGNVLKRSLIKAPYDML